MSTAYSKQHSSGSAVSEDIRTSTVRPASHWVPGSKQGAPFDQQVMTENGAAVVPSQVEVAVLRHVDECRRVCRGLKDALELRVGKRHTLRLSKRPPAALSVISLCHAYVRGNALRSPDHS